MSDAERFIQFCESEFGSTVMDREAVYVKQHVASEDRILDVGCGIGPLEERFTSYDILGVDQSEAMVRAARERTDAQFLHGDARALPIAPGTVDSVVVVATLSFISDLGTALSEAIRVLNSDGTFVALVLNTQSEYVRTHLQREGSYFQRMVHRDSEDVVATIFEFVDGTQEYVLGIADETVIETTNPTTAALSAVVGVPQ